MIAATVKKEVFEIVGFIEEREVFCRMTEAIARLLSNAEKASQLPILSWNDDLGISNKDAFFLMLKALSLYQAGFDDEAAKYESLAVHRLKSMMPKLEPTNASIKETKAYDNRKATAEKVAQEKRVKALIQKVNAEQPHLFKKLKTNTEWWRLLIILLCTYELINGKELVVLGIMGLFFLYSIATSLKRANQDDVSEDLPTEDDPPRSPFRR